MILNLWFAHYKAKNNFKEWLKLFIRQEDYQIEEKKLPKIILIEVIKKNDILIKKITENIWHVNWEFVIDPKKFGAFFFFFG